jgi:uncharacterized protein YfdQ (DUF2303 family)
MDIDNFIEKVGDFLSAENEEQVKRIEECDVSKFKVAIRKLNIDLSSNKEEID